MVRIPVDEARFGAAKELRGEKKEGGEIASVHHQGEVVCKYQKGLAFALKKAQCR